ncbi:MAG: lysophospholipid acyltransferase family protein [Acidobacteriota bacterium]
MKLKERFLLMLATGLGPLLIRTLRLLMVLEHRGRGAVEALSARGENYILAFWHGQLLMMPCSYPGRRISVLISEHRDGELISRTLGRLGFEVTRGSTTSGGARALRQLVRLARQHYDVAITPDGPRGPRHRVQAGVIELARLSRLPIIPVAFGCSKKKTCAPGTTF